MRSYSGPIPLVAFLVLATIALESRAEPLVISGPTMGTTYHVKLLDVPKDKAEPLRSSFESVLADVDRRLSTYRKDSEVCRFNRAPAGEWFAVSPATVETVEAAIAVSRQTGGALDITVGPLVRLWHFGPAALQATGSTDDFLPPDAAALEAVRNRIGFEKLDVRREPPGLRKQIAGLEIDLSAIGEGDAIDRLVATIQAHGVENFLVELGGEVRAVGQGPGGRPWRVAVQRPVADRAEQQSAVSLSNMALATSGDYRRFFENDGRRYSHIIDPSTARPVSHQLGSVTVANQECRTADAWATALFVLGPQRGYQCAVEHEIGALFISREGDTLSARETPNWTARFPTTTTPLPTQSR